MKKSLGSINIDLEIQDNKKYDVCITATGGNRSHYTDLTAKQTGDYVTYLIKKLTEQGAVKATKSTKTYENFVKVSHSYDKNACGRILGVDYKTGSVTFKFQDNVSKVSINTLVENVINDGFGGITNPSLLKDWSGWDK
jgi:hypothetical protein